MTGNERPASEQQSVRLIVCRQHAICITVARVYNFTITKNGWKYIWWKSFLTSQDAFILLLCLKHKSDSSLTILIGRDLILGQLGREFQTRWRYLCSVRWKYNKIQKCDIPSIISSIRVCRQSDRPDIRQVWLDILDPLSILTSICSILWQKIFENQILCYTTLWWSGKYFVTQQQQIAGSRAVSWHCGGV